jgi:hypothetical protein
MILEYYYKPNLVPPLSFFDYVYRIFWILWNLIDKLKVKYQKSKKVTPTDSNISNKSTNKNKLNKKGYKIFFG